MTPQSIEAAREQQAKDRQEFEAATGLKLDAEGRVIMPKCWELFLREAK